jgi:hypothetical protein
MAPANKNKNGKNPRKVTRRSPRTRILEELDAIKAMVAKHCVSDARHPVVPVAPVATTTTTTTGANLLAQMPLPQTANAGKVMVPVPEKKKAVSCPGGPKAYNEFIKQFRAEHPGMNYQTALKNGAKAWYTQCGLPQPVKKNKTNKNKKAVAVAATTTTVNKPKGKTPAVSRKAKNKKNKGMTLVAPTGFQQAAPMMQQQAYNPFDDFEETVPGPTATTTTTVPTEKIGAWTKVGRNEETDLNIYRNNKGSEIYRTSNAGVFGRGANGSIGEWVGVMRPDGTINTDIEAPM